MMPSPYSEESLKQHFRVGDSKKWKVDIEKDIDEIVKSASGRAASNTPGLLINSKIDKSGKTIYFAGDIETDILLRATYKRLMRQRSIVLPNRESIVNGILEATSEACPYLVTKCDIRAFYESLDAEPIIRGILVDTRVSPDLKSVLRAIYDAAGIPKSVAPRGLAISAVIAELTLKDFDSRIRKVPGVHRYFRYADDIIVFSLPSTPLLPIIQCELNALGLELNEKTENQEVRANPPPNTEGDPLVAAYSYLGYEFSAAEKVDYYKTREFTVSIAPIKLKKRMTRMFLALHAFKNDEDGGLLIDRLIFLSTNRSVYKTKHTRGSRKQKIRTGIHYNYSSCGHYPASKRGRVYADHTAGELVKIDAVLKSAVKSGEFTAAVATLPPELKDKLQNISFAQGYKKRLMKGFTRERVGQICKVWGHE
ncbi:antiviral reverse transcriptase Drt3a [Hoeflea sp. Naph1]|uniref:antiviral reverse transcriptase Drt3a n=1 Tax=Hoeflea sp. Naph1 TaxID=3388653 RepID=UPI00398FF32A